MVQNIKLVVFYCLRVFHCSKCVHVWYMEQYEDYSIVMLVYQVFIMYIYLHVSQLEMKAQLRAGLSNLKT